jgi:hypothetical protein
MNKEDKDTILRASRALQLVAAYTVVSDENSFAKSSTNETIDKKMHYLTVAYDLYLATIAAAAATAALSVAQIAFGGPTASAYSSLLATVDVLLLVSATGQAIQEKILKDKLATLKDVKKQSEPLYKDEEFNTLYQEFLSYRKIVFNGKEILSKKLDACRAVNAL